MSVNVIRPQLTDEEREERLKEVGRCAADVFRAMQSKNRRTYDKICVMCGEHFQATSGYSKCCDACRPKYKEMQKRRDNEKHNAKYRAKQEEMMRTVGKVFTCIWCGRTYRVHEKTQRKICTECLRSRNSRYCQVLLENRREIKEEMIQDVTD